MSNHAVENGVLQRVSPSQIRTFSRCNRKWYLEKVKRLRTPQTETQARGSTIHKQIELFYKEGKPVEHPSAKLALETLLPRPAGYPETLKVEHSFELAGLVHPNIPVSGQIDLLDTSNANIPSVVDIKSTSAFKWAKSERDLRTDTQLSVYAAVAAGDASYVPVSVSVSHVYLLTHGVGCLPVTTQLGQEELDTNLTGIKSTVLEMVDVAAEPDYLKVPKNDEACYDYKRKCPYYDVCHNGASIMTLQQQLEATVKHLEDIADPHKPGEIKEKATSAKPKPSKTAVKFTQVTVSRTVNLGNFNSKRVEVVGDVVGGNVDQAYAELDAKVSELVVEGK